MTIVHEVIKYKKEDGTEVEVVPLKEIVVTAPGYYTWGADWRADLANGSRQETQLYTARNAVYPSEADYCETIDMQTGSNGGRARFRTYIEKAKLSQLRENIRKSMAYGKPKDTLFKGKKLGLGFSSDHKFLPIDSSSKIERILKTPGWLIGFRNNVFGRDDAIFYMPEGCTEEDEYYKKDSPIGFIISYDFAIREGYRNKVNKNWIVIEGQDAIRKSNLKYYLGELENSREGLIGRIRAEIFRELLSEHEKEDR